MRKAVVRVVASENGVRARLLNVLLRIGSLAVDEESAPDVLCIGCERELPVDLIEHTRKLGGMSRIPVALVAWQGSELLAVQAFRAGIRQYIPGTSNVDEIAAVLLSLYRPESTPHLISGEILVGESSTMLRTKNYIERVARTASNVLITGETGTGKELIAELIHRNSPRACKPFVCVNCAAIPEALFESELFGYERGAFTGAHRTQDGKFKMADGGTIFLDEIGDMGAYAQAKILRVIESREVQRLGSSKSNPVDLRIVAATNCDLETLSKQDKFRRDLFFRLNVARIHLPPLRERREDLLPLAEHFRLQYNSVFRRDTVGFTLHAEKTIERYSWPGNVRELKNIIEAAFINLDPECVWVELPELFYRAVDGELSENTNEVDRITAALAEAQWNKSKAAEILSCSRMTLYRKMERYGILSIEHTLSSAKV